MAKFIFSKALSPSRVSWQGELGSESPLRILSSGLSSPVGSLNKVKAS